MFESREKEKVRPRIPESFKVISCECKLDAYLHVLVLALIAPMSRSSLSPLP